MLWEKRVENKSCLEPLETYFYIAYAIKYHMFNHIVGTIFYILGCFYKGQIGPLEGRCGPYVVTSFKVTHTMLRWTGWGLPLGPLRALLLWLGGVRAVAAAPW